MTVLEGLLSGLEQSLDPVVLPLLFTGAIFGLVIGVIPGLSGHFAMAILLSFLYAMEPASGIAFLLAAHATVAQGGGLTAILFSTPGTGQNAATLLDGPAMRENGEAGVAVGAAMTACLIGACFGGLVLALMIPVLREVVLFFGSAEIFMLAVLGLIFVATLGRRDLLRSLIAGLLGLLLAMVGVDNAANIPRFTLGVEVLEDGLPLVPVVLGLFAVAEMIALWKRGGSLMERHQPNRTGYYRQIGRGVRAALEHRWLVLRCSAIGTLMGIVPGLGSAPASFVAYAHAQQSSATPEAFGTGCVEGVIAPEAANDAVEGGALASTVAFGVPGSSSMAILLSGLTILGLETGPRMLNEDVDILFLMVFTIILGNLIGTVGGVLLANPLLRLAAVPGRIMVPIVVAIVATGSYASDLSVFHVSVAMLFGLVGYVCSLLRYSRAALLIGFVLGHPVEYNLNLALQIDGPFFFLEPVPLLLLCLGLAFLVQNLRTHLRDRRSAVGLSGKASPEALDDAEEAARRFSLETAFLSVVIAAAAVGLASTLFSVGNKVIPLVVLLPLAVLALSQSFRVRRLRPEPATSRGRPRTDEGARFAAWLFALCGGIVLIGHYAAVFLFVFGLSEGRLKKRRLSAAVLAAAIAGVLFLVFEKFLDVTMYRGLIFRYLAGYRDI